MQVPRESLSRPEEKLLSFLNFCTKTFFRISYHLPSSKISHLPFLCVPISKYQIFFLSLQCIFMHEIKRALMVFDSFLRKLKWSRSR